MAANPPEQISVDAAEASASWLLGVVQFIGTIALLFTCSSLFLIIVSADGSDIAKLTGFIFIGIGGILGLVGLWGSLPFDIIELSKLKVVPNLNNIFVIASVISFILAAIIGVWGSRMYTDVGDMSAWNLFGVLAFSFCLIAFLELGSTANHFYDVKKFAKKHNLKKENLNLNILAGKYILWFIVLFAIVFIYSWFVLDLQNVIIKMMGEGLVIAPYEIGGLSPQFANSLILNSIYGVALSMAIVFIPFVILITLMFGGKGKVEEEFEAEELL